MGDLPPNPSVRNRRVTVLFAAILAAGIILRIISSVFSQGFIYPDEHQEYLEVAQGLVYGPHISWWEYERGIRHYLYPGFLAVLLTALDRIGVRDPIYQATTIRAFLALALFVSLALLARDWMRMGRTAGAICLLAVAALSPDIIYMSIRTLSETAATIPFILSLFFFKRAPFLSGLMLGIMFAIRFQTAFFIPGIFALSLHDDWSARSWRKGATVRLSAGLTLSLLAIGLMDKATWGQWFHSPLESFQAQILEGIAARYGVAPWYQYLNWGANLLSECLPFFGILLFALGLGRERRLAFVGLIFLIGHSVIDRKDARFLWPLAPLALVAFAAGFEGVYRWLPARRARMLLVALVSCCFLGGSWLRVERLNWNPEPARSSSLALTKIGRYPDVTGVAIFNLPSAECGNYFFLRRDVPLLVKDVTDPSDIAVNSLWPQGAINYVITWPKDTARFAKYHLEEVELIHGLGIYKVR